MSRGSGVPTQPREKKLPAPSWTATVKAARQGPMPPLQGAMFDEVVDILSEVPHGTYCEFVYLTERSHMTRKGYFAGFDGEVVSLQSEKGPIYRVPLAMTIYATQKAAE